MSTLLDRTEPRIDADLSQRQTGDDEAAPRILAVVLTVLAAASIACVWIIVRSHLLVH